MKAEVLELMFINNVWVIHSNVNDGVDGKVIAETPLELSQLILKWAQSHEVVTA